MKVIKQISVIIDNTPGTLARIGAALREQEINVFGFAAWGESDHGIVRIVCDRPLKALDVLEEAGMIALQHDILELSLKNRPGALYEVAGVLSEAGINIHYAYGSTLDQDQGALYLGVTDPAAARKALRTS